MPSMDDEKWKDDMLAALKTIKGKMGYVRTLAKDELVIYDKLSVCEDVYDNLSGILLRDKLNDVVPTPNTEYDPS